MEDKGEEKTENEIKTQQCEVTEQDELKGKEKTENENEAKQKEVAEKDESKDNEEEKPDTSNEGELKGNEKEESDNEEDTEKIRISKSRITITAMTLMLRGETRAQYMCRLARELKRRNKSQPTKDEWDYCSSQSDTSTAVSASKTQDLADSVM